MEKQKTVLMVLDHEFPPDPRVQNEITAMLGNGYDVHLACFTKENRPSLEFTPEGLTIHRKVISSFIHKTSVAALKAPIYFNFWKKFLNLILKKNTFHAIHVHDLPLASVGIQLAKKVGIPVMLDLHENWPHMLRAAKHTNTTLGKILSSNHQWDRYEKKMTMKADAILTVVPEMAQRVANIAGNPPKIFVYQNVPNLSELGTYTTPKKTQGTFQLMYAGGITEARGVQNIIQALCILKDEHPDFQFTVIGDGAYLSDIKNLVNQLNLNEKVEFTGWVQQNEVMNHLQKAHLAVIPHLRSTQNDNSSPNKIFQYMWSKTAVLTSNCTSLERVVNENKCGWVYEHDSAQDAALKIKIAINDRELAIHLGEKGHDAVNQKFNLEVEKENLLNAYKFLFEK